MRKRIHLTESQLRRLVEQSINEISTETKMSAAQKATRQAQDYREQFLDKSTPRLKRKYAKDMAKRRDRQSDTFIKGVNSDAEKTFGVRKAEYFPGLYHSPYRGSMLVNEPVDYDCTGTKPFYNSIMPSDRKRWEDYLRGNSYYENGEWKRPYYNSDYDIAKSEPWAEIRKRSNESIAHRVTENVIRMLRESSEDLRGYLYCQECYVGGSDSYYAVDGKWTDYTPQQLAQALEEMIIYQLTANCEDLSEQCQEGVDEDIQPMLVQSDDDVDEADGTNGYPLALDVRYKAVTRKETAPNNRGGQFGRYVTEMVEFHPDFDSDTVSFAGGDSDPRTNLVWQALKMINWNRIGQSLEPAVYES